MMHTTFLVARAVVVIALLVGPNASLGKATDQTILLRNVFLIDRKGAEETVHVNILLKNGLLDIITEDLIPLDQADQAYDANGGFVMGRLDLGQAASFLILTGDPRENVELLLDTKQYTSFAIRRGEVLKNTYSDVTVEADEIVTRASRGWSAYAAPPIAVPLNYFDETRWNKYEGKWVSGLFGAALLLDRQYWTDQDSNSKLQVGDVDVFDGGEIRGLRVGGVGTLNFDSPWVWTVFAATHAFDLGFDSSESDELSLFDLRLDIPLWENVSFSIGKQKEPISMERIMSLVNLPMQERAAGLDAMLPSRNVGMVVSGTLFGERVTLAGGLFNNWLDKDQPASFRDNATQYVGRLTWLPYLSENENVLLHLGVGLRVSDAKEAVTGSTRPEFNQAPDYLFTGPLQAEDITTYQAEVSLRNGPFWLHGEYVRSRFDSASHADPSFSGYHVTGSWILTGEMRAYNRRVGIFNRVPIARTVNQNGWGAVELSGRFSHTDLTDSLIDGGEMDIWSLGVTWWLTPFMSAGVDYRYITLDRLGVEGHSSGVTSRIVLLLE